MRGYDLILHMEGQCRLFVYGKKVRVRQYLPDFYRYPFTDSRCQRDLYPFVSSTLRSSYVKKHMRVGVITCHERDMREFHKFIKLRVDWKCLG